MIKVDANSYFNDLTEIQLYNEYLKQDPTRSFNDYVREKFNATYESDYWNSSGHFVFEKEWDAILFMLKWSCG
jgi:hypothetical protein